MTRLLLIMSALFIAAAATLTMCWESLGREAAAHQRAREAHRKAAALSLVLQEIRSRPSAVIKVDAPEADAADWILEAARHADVPVDRITARTTDGSRGSAGMRKRTVICTADTLRPQQADAIIQAVHRRAPAWRVQMLDIAPLETGGNEQALLRISLTLEATIM